VINDGKIAEDLRRRENNAGAKFVRAELEAKILRFEPQM